MTNSNAMYGAIARNDVDAVRRLVADDPSLLTTYFLENSWLHLAAQMGRINLMEALVNAGQSVDHLTSDGMRTPLDTAAGQGHYKACEWLLDHAADINHGFGKTATPIFSAIFSKSLDLVKSFVQRGANLDATFGDPKIDVLTYAQRHGTPEIVDFLKRSMNCGL